MIVAFGDSPEYGPLLILGIVDTDLEKIRAGLTLQYVDPPHDAQLVRNVLVVHAATKADLVAQFRAAGVEVTEEFASKAIAGERTDRGMKEH